MWLKNCCQIGVINVISEEQQLTFIECSDFTLIPFRTFHLPVGEIGT